MALNRAALVIVGSILFATTLGNSIYWKKSWTHQSQIINEIQSNQEIISLPENTILIVFDNGYIKQNIFENTEFLRMPWNLRAIFSMHEQVHLWNITQGTRLTTYIMEYDGDEKGIICVNGAAAHRANPGDRVILATFAEIDSEKAENWEPHIVIMNENNTQKE